MQLRPPALRGRGPPRTWMWPVHCIARRRPQAAACMARLNAALNMMKERLELGSTAYWRESVKTMEEGEFRVRESAVSWARGTTARARQRSLHAENAIVCAFVRPACCTSMYSTLSLQERGAIVQGSRISRAVLKSELVNVVIVSEADYRSDQKLEAGGSPDHPRPTTLPFDASKWAPAMTIRDELATSLYKCTPCACLCSLVEVRGYVPCTDTGGERSRYRV